MNIELAANILRKGKLLAPDRFPQPSPEVGRVWAEALGSIDFPPELWSEAVTLWATHLVGDRMVTPRDLIGAAYSVRDRWESEPARAGRLVEYRVRRANVNYARNGLESIGAADLPTGSERSHGAGGGAARRQQSGPEAIGTVGRRQFGEGAGG